MFKLDTATIKEISQGFHIPSQPAALIELNRLKQNEFVDLIEAAEIVATDMELSAMVLKAINSSFFGLSKKVANIKEATIALGLDNLFRISAACAMKQSFYTQKGHSCLSFERFWDEALETAELCIEIASLYGDDVSLSDAYSLGLFHDCGIASMSINYTDYRELLLKANASVTRELIDFEQRRYGVNHALVGCIIAQSWQLPDSLCHIIALHHQPELLHDCKNPQQKQLIAVLFMAQNIVAKKRNGKELSMWPKVASKIRGMFKITEQEMSDFFIEQIAQK